MTPPTSAKGGGSRGGSGGRPPQIPLDLTPTPTFSFENFITVPSNADAFALISAWPDWPTPHLLLIGPPSCGKTHLGEAWTKQSGGWFIDDAEQRSDDELFAAINSALRGDIPGLLMASQSGPADWGVKLPDLTSRLGATPSITLDEPDDESLRPIMRVLFERRGRVVPEDVIDYLLKHAERSVPALRATITAIDEAARIEKADVTRNFAAKILRQSWDLFPD